VKRFRVVPGQASYHNCAAWANGADERVMRELVHLYGTLMVDLNMTEGDRRILRPIIQAILNQMPSTVRAGFTPFLS
jgi:hypothetical protein